MKNNKIKTIPINIWDDFYDDGYIPENEIQETYAYVEDNDLSHEFSKECLSVLLSHIQINNYLPNVELSLVFHNTIDDYDANTVKKCIEIYGENFFFKRWEIKFKNITHKMLDNLMEKLNKVTLSYNDTPFRIYSES